MIGRLLLILVVLASGGAGATSVSALSARASAPPARSLAITEAPTPRLNVRGYETAGTFLQVTATRGAAHVGVKAVNAALRAVVLWDERAYAPHARRWRRTFARDDSVYATRPGLYATTVDRKLVSASSVVVSAVLPAVRERAQSEGGAGWLAFIVDARSARRVTIDRLFRDSAIGRRAFGMAWVAAIRGDVCAANYRAVYPEAAQFALLPEGVAVAVPRVGACGGNVTTVPYRALRPLLSSYGRLLVDGVRAPAAR
jgi:hypothetical protein